MTDTLGEMFFYIYDVMHTIIHNDSLKGTGLFYNVMMIW